MEGKYSYWDYRIVRQPSQMAGEEWFEIFEVYYDREGKPESYGDATIGGDTVEVLTENLARLHDALGKTVLDVSAITHHQSPSGPSDDWFDHASVDDMRRWIRKSRWEKTVGPPPPQKLPEETRNLALRHIATLNVMSRQKAHQEKIRLVLEQARQLAMAAEELAKKMDRLDRLEGWAIADHEVVLTEEEYGRLLDQKPPEDPGMPYGA